MLRSRTTRLVAAFNHQHIFIDPDPDAERSFAERERLFDLPRSTWADYDTSTISAGGGIFERSAKEIPLSPQARALLDLQAEAPSGEEVIRHILTMKVDLLYNGGIGTYVKAAGEDNAEVGDRANDRVRVDADERSRPRDRRRRQPRPDAGRHGSSTGRKGGLINTDAIDNSAGVDMSDHEVNLKVLLDVLLHDGLIKGRDDRNRILREMTDEVSELVLADNEQQALALTLDGLRSAALYDDYVAFVDDLVVAGIINRDDDGVPTRDELLLSNPARGSRAAAAAAGGADGPRQELGAGDGAEDLVPRQRHGAPVPRRVLPEAAARGLRRRHSPSTRCDARSSPRPRSTTSSTRRASGSSSRCCRRAGRISGS